MKYKVEYKTDTGTRSDDEFIGIYDSPGKAANARKKYIDDEVGTQDEFLIANGYQLGDPDGIEDYNYSLSRLQGCVWIEKVENKY